MLAAQVSLLAVATALFVHGAWAMSRIPHDTPGPFLMWLLFGLVLPYLLVGTALVLGVGMIKKGSRRGFVGLVGVAVFVVGTAAAMGRDAMMAVFFGLPAFAVGAGIGALVCWIANDDPASRRRSAEGEPEQ
jgi:hypothetical protein